MLTLPVSRILGKLYFLLYIFLNFFVINSNTFTIRKKITTKKKEHDHNVEDYYTNIYLILHVLLQYDIDISTER